MKTIPLTRGYSTTVDDDDFEDLSKFKWLAIVHEQKGYRLVYAARQKKRYGKASLIYMHRYIMGCEKRVDHKDGDGLNNQEVQSASRYAVPKLR